MRRNISQSLTTINLKDLLSDKEINDVIIYSQFKSCKERDYIYEKDELCYKLVSIVIDKFKEMKESSLLKCLLWMQKQLQIFLQGRSLHHQWHTCLFCCSCRRRCSP